MQRYTAEDRTGKTLRPGGKRVFGPALLAWLTKRQKHNGRGLTVSRYRSPVDKLLHVAHANVGVMEVPAGSNSGAQVVQYQRATNVPGTGWPWCMAFVSWCCREAQIPLGYRGGYVPAFRNWAAAAGRLTHNPRRGMAVIFQFDTGAVDHVGIVASVVRDRLGRAVGVNTYEGNTSNAGSQSNGGEVCFKYRPIAVCDSFVKLT